MTQYFLFSFRTKLKFLYGTACVGSAFLFALPSIIFFTNITLDCLLVPGYFSPVPPRLPLFLIFFLFLLKNTLMRFSRFLYLGHVWS